MRKLEAFCRVYEQRSFSGAGKVLFLSQPTVSAHVQALEKELGVKLLDRMGRTVLPTAAGTVLYRRVIRAIDELEAAKNEIALLLGDMAGEITLGCSTIPAYFLMPEIIADFAKMHPKTSFQLMVGDSTRITDAVLAGSVMLAVVGAYEKHVDLEFTPIINDELVIVGTPEIVRAVGCKRGCTLRDAAAWPWVMRAEGSGTRRIFEQGVTEAGLRPGAMNVVLAVDNAPAALQYALAGLGVTATSRLAVQKHLEREELVELKPAGLALKRKFYMVRNLRRELFPAASRFASFVGEAAAEALHM